MSPPVPVPVPIPLTNSSQTQIVPQIQNDDQLPFKATLRTLSSFIKDNHKTPTQSTTTIPLPSTFTSTPTSIRKTPTSPLSQSQTYTQPQPHLQPLPKSPQQTIQMAHTTTTVTTRPSLFARLRGGKTHRRTYENTTHGHSHATHATPGVGVGAGARRQRTWGRRSARTAQPVHHHHRKPSMGDKISGAMMKLRGSLTRRTGLKAAGTRRMRGTDGKGSHHVTAY